MNDTSQERVDEIEKQRHDAPPQRTWVGLTEDERGGILVTYCEAGLWRLSEAIEAKLKEKNT